MPRPPQPPEVVVAGHICLDVIPAFAHEALFAPGRLVEVGPPVIATGGAVSNTGLALHRLGLRTRLAARVGDDLFGRAVLDVLRTHGAALADGLRIAPGEPTSYTLVVSPPGVDRMFLHCPGVNETFDPADVPPDAFAGARLFHFGYPPLMRQTYADGGAALAALFTRLHDRGLAVSLDMAQPDPDSEAGRVDWAAWLERVLPCVDVFCPSLEETLFMLDRPRYERLRSEGLSTGLDAGLLDDLARRLLAMQVPVVGLKLGDRGLYLRTAPDAARLSRLPVADAGVWTARELLSPCFRTDVAGTTGAGDCTIAGLLAAFLRGLTPEAAVNAAVAVGACSVEQPDAVSGVPAWPEVDRRIRAGWAKHPLRLALPGWREDAGAALWYGPHDRHTPSLP